MQTMKTSWQILIHVFAHNQMCFNRYRFATSFKEIHVCSNDNKNVKDYFVSQINYWTFQLQ